MIFKTIGMKIIPIHLGEINEEDFIRCNPKQDYFIRTKSQLPKDDKDGLHNYKWDVSKQTIILDTEANKIEKLKLQEMSTKQKYENIEAYIYNQYSQKKQSQDDKKYLYYKQFLSKDEEKQILPLSGGYFKKKTLSLKEDSNLLIVVKIAIKTHWIRLCADEGKLAIQESREPIYLEFPKFNLIQKGK